MGRVLIAGGTGFVGTALAPALRARGWEVLTAARKHADRTLDLDRPATIGPALEGCDAAVFLIHRMGASTEDLEASETAGAVAFLAEAERLGVRRIVYLGGPVPAGPASKHLASRLATGRVLRSGTVSTIELRAGMIVGVGSESWMICRDLALRLPVMVLPKWLGTRSQPVWIGDVVEALAEAVGDPLEGSAAFDLPGPETLSARQILERVAARRGMRPLMIPVPLLTPRLSSWWLGGVTRANTQIARQLVDGLTHDLVAPDDGYWSRTAHVRLSFDEAVTRALAEELPPERRRERVWEALVPWVALPAR